MKLKTTLFVFGRNNIRFVAARARYPEIPSLSHQPTVGECQNAHKSAGMARGTVEERRALVQIGRRWSGKETNRYECELALLILVAAETG